MTSSSNHPPEAAQAADVSQDGTRRPTLHQLSECLEGAEDRGAFERLKAQAELQYRRTRTFASTLDTQEGRQEATAELVLLVRSVFFEYHGLRGRMNQAAADAALMAIIDYYFDLYFRRDRQLSDAEEAAVKGQMRWMVISSSREWEQRLAERNVSTDATTSAAGGPSERRNGASARSRDETAAIPIDAGADAPPELLEARKAERKAARDAYKAECKAAGVTVTDEMIARAANPNWTSRTQVQKWLQCHPDYEGEPDRLIRLVFSKKPHITSR